MSKISSSKANVNDLEASPLEPLEPNTLIIDNPALRRGFTAIPNYILSNPAVSFGARLTYSLLLSYAWKQNSCFPGQDKLSADLGVNKRSVVRYLQELEDLGFIKAKRRGFGQTNVYHILDVDPDKIFNQARSDNMSSPEVTPVSHQEVTPVSPHNKEEEDSEKNNNTGGETATDVAASLRRVGVSKKASERLISHFSLKRILQKIDYLTYLQESKPDGIKDPAAWVRRATEDDYAPPAGYKSKEEREAEAAAREKRRRETDQEIAAQEQQSRPAQSWQEWVIENQNLSDNLIAITDQLREVLRQELPEITYNTWAKQLMVVELSDETARVAVPSQAARAGLIDHRALFDTTLTQMIGHPIVTSLEIVKQPLER